LITRKCNYRCRGCNVWREQDANELSCEEVIQGLGILKNLGVVDIVFSGGAPLLRDDIDEILAYASRYFITTVYDNGSLATKKIDALRNVDFVAISLDTLNPEKNDYAKGVKGSWQKAMETINTLHSEGINVCISPTISQLNLHEIIDLTRHFTAKNIPVLYCLYSYDNVVDHGQLFRIGKQQDEYNVADREAMVNLCNTLMDMKKKDSNILMTAQTLKAVKHLFLDGRRTWKCHALQNFFMIDHKGRVAGCHLRSPVASIFDLPKVWNSTKFKELRKKYRECTGCIYLCYIFYSIHGSVIGNFQVAQEKWKTARLLLKKKKATPLSLAAQQ
jgi:MoaA/NifB/PqqE/SkfB family radical SAM enzyme